jgi:Family of unknown function (DUF6893)
MKSITIPIPLAALALVAAIAAAIAAQLPEIERYLKVKSM